MSEVAISISCTCVHAWCHADIAHVYVQNDSMTASAALDTVKSVLAFNGTIGIQSVAVGVSSSVSHRSAWIPTTPLLFSYSESILQERTIFFDARWLLDRRERSTVVAESKLMLQGYLMRLSCAQYTYKGKGSLSTPAINASYTGPNYEVGVSV